VPPLIHFIPDSLRESVLLFLKRQCDRTLGLLAGLRALREAGAVGRVSLGMNMVVAPQVRKTRSWANLSL
jgi:hypothetical protein